MDFPDRVRAALADRYEIERELGRGGMALVYLARDLKHDRNVAIKILRPEVSATLGADRFLREIQIAARLQHPHIVPLYDSGLADGLLYYVMPYVEGETLRQRIRREKQLAIDDALQISREVADALSYAHSHDLVHRDIKPENVLLSGGHAMVADFGIARAVSAAGGDQLTDSGVAIGTPAYMSPEQGTGEADLDGRTDIYALGCVLFEMLAGEPPFTGPTGQAIIARHVSERPPSLRIVRPTVSAEMESTIQKALAKVPADRFRTVRAFVDDLTDTGDALEVLSSRRTGWRRVRNVALGALVSLLVVSGVLMVAEAVRTGNRGDEAPMIVVLPFENLGTPSDRFFADGITEELTSRLAQIGALGVISRASAITYFREPRTIGEIRRDLGVQYVLSGTVRTERDSGGAGTVRVIPHLMRVADSREVWTDQYTARLEPGEIVHVQAGIVGGVAEALNVTLSQRLQRSLDSHPTDHLEAYKYYLQGSSYSGELYTQDVIRRAIVMYDSAVALDSGFALAYAKLAQAQSIYYAYFDHSQERLEAARTAVERAFALDSTLSEATLALGYFYYWGLNDFDLAMEAFDRVREFRPNNSDLLWAIGSLYRRKGRWEQSLAISERALELDPRSYTHAHDLGATNLMLRRYDTAEQYLRRAIGLAPDWLPPYVTLAFVHQLRGDVEASHQVFTEALRYFDRQTILAPIIVRFRWLLALIGQDFTEALYSLSLESLVVDSASYYLAQAESYRWEPRPAPSRAYYDSARVILERRLRTRPSEAVFYSDLGVAYAGLGRHDDALEAGRRAVELLPPNRDAFGSPPLLANLAQIYVMVGEQAAALDQLEQLLGMPAPLSAPFVQIHPNFAPHHGDRRFREIVSEGHREW